MRNTAFILCIMIVCVSCSSFQHMRYRHLKKVPATTAITCAEREVNFCVPVSVSDTVSVGASCAETDSVQTAQAKSGSVAGEVAGTAVLQVVAPDRVIQNPVPSAEGKRSTLEVTKEQLKDQFEFSGSADNISELKGKEVILVVEVVNGFPSIKYVNNPHGKPVLPKEQMSEFAKLFGTV